MHRLIIFALGVGCVAPETIAACGQQAPYRAAGLPLELQTGPLVIYARTRARSRMLARCLREGGHPFVHDLGVASDW